MAAARMHLKPRHGHEERACQSAWMQMQKRCSTAQDTGQGATWQCSIECLRPDCCLTDGPCVSRLWFVATSGSFVSSGASVASQPKA